MKKSLLILLFAIMLSFVSYDDVYAASGKLGVTTNVSTATSGASFTVNVVYTGDMYLMSMHMNVSTIGATCEVKSQATNAVGYCSGEKCDYIFSDAHGYASNTKMLSLSCSSTASQASFEAFIVDDDASGMKNPADMLEDPVAMTISKGTAKVTITNGTTKKTTTTTTTAKTTTKKTTKKTTVPIASNSDKITTKPITTKPTTTAYTTTEKPTLVITTTTTEATTTKEKKTTEPVTTNIAHLSDDLKLKSLDIVGYDIEFSKNNTGYVIEVADNVDEVYVIAESVDPTNSIENVGIVKIDKKKSFNVKVYNPEKKTEVIYTVKIQRNELTGFQKLYNNIFKPTVAITFIFTLLFFMGFLLYLGKQRRLEKLDSRDDERYAVPEAPSSFFAQLTELEKEEKEEKELFDAGIVEIPETEEQLTRVFLEMNNRNKKD